MRNVFNENGLQEQLAELPGRWVAIRSDHVVADAATLSELIHDERVERTDTRLAVPRRHEAPITHPLSTLSSFVLPYVVVLDEGDPPPPVVEVEVRGPAGATPYACLLDSGANHSAFPVSCVEDFGIAADDLTPTNVRTAGRMRPGLALARADILQVEIHGEPIPIRPYFLLDQDEEAGVEFEEHDPVLGRDSPRVRRGRLLAEGPRGPPAAIDRPTPSTRAAGRNSA